MVSKIWDWWHTDRQPAEQNRVCVLHFLPFITLSCTKPPCVCVHMCVVFVFMRVFVCPLVWFMYNMFCPLCLLFSVVTLSLHLCVYVYIHALLKSFMTIIPVHACLMSMRPWPFHQLSEIMHTQIKTHHSLSTYDPAEMKSERRRNEQGEMKEKIDIYWRSSFIRLMLCSSPEALGGKKKPCASC